jgi:hypothetical protein
MMPLYREHPKLVVLLIIIVALGILAGGLLLFLQVQGSPDLTVTDPSANDAVVLEGTYVCLPRNDKSKTAECSPGLQTADGTYYALDLGQVIGAGGDPQLKNGEKVAVGGLLLQLEDISTDQWDVYPVTRVMRVEEVARP